MPTYPAQIDSQLTLPMATDNFTPVNAAVFNPLRNAVIALETTLGIQPQGIYTSVGSRLMTLEGIVGNLQIIELAQDLGGTLESPLVIGLQGHPVSNIGPLVNEVLTWDGIAWIPSPPKGLIDVALACDLAGDKSCQIVVGLQGNPVSSTAPTYSGEFLIWSGSEWTPGPSTPPSTGQVLQWNGTAWGPVNLVSPPGPSQSNIFPFVSGNFTTNSPTPVRIGGREINMSTFPSSIGGRNLSAHFRATIETTSSAATTQIQLFDVTNNIVIGGTIGTTTNYTGLVLFDSGPLTIGTSNGDIRTDMVPIYEVQMSMTTGNPSSDRAICANARVDIIYS